MLKDLNPIQSSEDGILTKLFRKIIIETGFINSINYFISRYSGNKSKTTISKLVLDGEMTWNSFTFLIIDVLKAKYITLTVTIVKDRKSYSSKTLIENKDFIEKESGKLLKESFNNMGKALNVKDNYKKFSSIYYKNGGKKNKATISKIMDSSSISWKSYIFLMFELLDNNELVIEASVKSIHGKITDHELIIKKND